MAMTNTNTNTTLRTSVNGTYDRKALRALRDRRVAWTSEQEQEQEQDLSDLVEEALAVLDQHCDVIAVEILGGEIHRYEVAAWLE